MSKSVKCADCGFLALRHKTTRQLVEVEERTRRDGAIPHNPAFNDECCEPTPVCFVESRYLADEFDNADVKGGRFEKLRHVLTNSRESECNGKFVKWRPGFSPKEMLEMEMLKEQRRWQERESEKNRSFEVEQGGLNRRQQRLSLGIAILAVVVSVLVALLKSNAPPVVTVTPLLPAPVVNLQLPQPQPTGASKE
jgi:hypothetical protein